MTRALRSIGLVVLVALSGCVSVGPKTVPRDRFDYATAITESWKRQTLLNIVKMRYLDPPIFVDVGQIVAGYSLETAITGGASFPETNTFGGNTFSLGAATRYVERPPVTYTHLTGRKFIRALLR